MRLPLRTVLIGGVVVLALLLLIIPRLGSANGDVEEPTAPSAAEEPIAASAEEEPPDAEATGSVAPFSTAFEDPIAILRTTRAEIFDGDIAGLPAPGSPLPTISRSFSGLVADFDGDGFDDIQLSRHQNSRFAATDLDGVWISDGQGGFGFAQPLVAFSDRHSCDAGDVNGDGHLDFYCTLGASRGSVALNELGEVRMKSNELWINQGDATFVELGEEWGVADPWGRGRDALFFDYDNDGDVDLYILNAYGRLDDLRSINILYANEGDRFVEVESGLNGEFGHKCPAVFDWNDDGWEDVMLCDGGIPIFFQNDGGEFTDVTDVVLSERKGWQHAVPADLDADGFDDLAVIRKGAVEIWLWQPGNGRFKIASKADFEGQGRWIAAGDFFGDESIDVYATVNRTDCTDPDTSSGNSHDVLVVGPDFEAFARGTHGLGCADRVYTVDGTRLLILNGAVKTRGPVELADLRTSVAPFAPLPILD